MTGHFIAVSGVRSAVGSVDRWVPVRYDPEYKAAIRAASKEIPLPKPSRKGISASKRLRQSLKRRQRNRSVKSKTRTLVGKAITFIGADVASAEEAVREAISGLDRAAQKGVIHPNAAARSKSRILKRFNLAQASAVAAAATAAPARKAAAEPAAEKAAEAPPKRRVLSRAPKAEEPAAKKATTRSTKSAAPKAASSEAKTPRTRTKKT